MAKIHFIFVFLLTFVFFACSTSPTDSSSGNSNKIPASFKGSWQLNRILCPNGATGGLADSINSHLKMDNSDTTLTLLFSDIQGPNVTSILRAGQETNASACAYSISQKWEKSGHWVEVSPPDTVKIGESQSEVCEIKKKELMASDVFKYIVPAGELSIESKNGMIHLYRTVGRSEKDLEVCQTSDRFIYELKKRED